MKQYLPAIFASLWLADTALTCTFVSLGGEELEANPLMNKLISSWGLVAFAGVKLSILLLYLSLSDRMSNLIHALLILIMSPVVFVGGLLCYSLLTS